MLDTDLKYGVDVATKRLDYLDKKLLQALKKAETVLDLGAGDLGFARAAVAAGALVTAVDIKKAQPDYCTYVESDIRDYVSSLEDTFDKVLLQRTLHYISYQEATTLLEKLGLHTDTLYVSVSGAESAISSHVDTTKSIVYRSEYLDQVGKKKFQITAPICLYYRAEFIELLNKTGWSVEMLRTSAFGNHQAICRR